MRFWLHLKVSWIVLEHFKKLVVFLCFLRVDIGVTEADGAKVLRWEMIIARIKGILIMIKSQVYDWVWIFQHINEYAVDQRGLQQLPWCWRKRIWRDRSQQVFDGGHPFFFSIIKDHGSTLGQILTVPCFWFSPTWTILPKEGMTLMLIDLHGWRKLPVRTDWVLEWHWDLC